MARVRVADAVAATPDAVWEMVRDFGGIQRWNGGAIEKVEVDGDGVGAVRTITAAGGVTLQEKLEAFDESGRSFSYSFEGKSPLPVEGYLATIRVRPGEAGGARIEWESSFEPVGISEQNAITIFEGIYRNGIAGLKQQMEG